MALITSAWEVLTDTSVLLGILIITLFMVLRFVLVDRSNGLPPGPRFRLPLVGNLYVLEPDMRKFLRRYRKKYGDIYSLYLGNKLVIIIAGYKNLKEAFVKNADVFSDRPHTASIFDSIADGKGVVSVNGDNWREQRKFSLRTLKNLGMGKSILEKTIHFEAELLLKEFLSKENNPFNPDQLFFAVSNVMNSLSFGGHFKHGDVRYAEMIQRVEENFSNIGVSSIGTLIPALAYLPGDIFKIKKTLANADTVHGWLRQFVNEHLENYDENNVNDLTSAFIKEMKKQEATKETTSFTVEQLVHLLGDLFVAGTETTASTLRWALVYLVNYPDIQDQICHDVIDVVGTDRLPCMQDKTKLTLIDAFIQEVLRHASLMFTTLGHSTSRDVEFGGYSIPMEATLLADMDSINRDRSVWKDPEVFRPQRFIAEDGTIQTPEEFIPFFLGHRSCIGESLARMELFLFIGAIVQNFMISAAPGEDLSLDKMDKFGLLHTPKAFNVLASPRGKLPF